MLDPSVVYLRLSQPQKTLELENLRAGRSCSLRSQETRLRHLGMVLETLPGKDSWPKAYSPLL